MKFVSHLVLFSLLSLLAASVEARAATPANLRDENLVAWCIVPFDAKERTPAERTEMLKRLGLRRVAYDWRENHVPTFEEEILQYKKHGIEYFAFWGAHEEAFQLFAKHDLHPQIWQTLGSPPGDSQEERVEAAARQMLPLVERTRKLGCKLGLYNHGGWGGEPANMVAVCQHLRNKHDAAHVGIVYNLHHGHGHVDDFADVLATMKPYLLCLNLNGMARDGEAQGQKILPLGEGELDVTLLKCIRDSGYDGPIGIIGHTQDDVELRLRDNLDGLHWILPQLDGKPAGPKPELRTYSAETTPSAPVEEHGGVLLENRDELRRAPISVECRVTLPDARGYNILVASDTKRSGEHWEIFSMNGSGMLTAYLPGRKPDHVSSQAMICDGKPHTIAMIYEQKRVRLIVDGQQVADQPVESLEQKGVPGGLAIGQLVEGGLNCRGSIQWVRVSRGAREIAKAPVIEAQRDDATLLLWKSDAPAKHEGANHGGHHRPEQEAVGFATPEYSPQVVAELIEKSRREGDPLRGLLTFAAAKSACLSCHRVGRHGGSVGPDLSKIGAQRKPEELVEAVLWPKRKVDPQYVSHLVIDDAGRSHQGYLVSKDDRHIVLRDPTKSESSETALAIDDIELHREVGTLMPENLAATMGEQELSSLLQFLLTLGTDQGIADDEMHAMFTHAVMHAHGPAPFAFERRPLQPQHWPNWQHGVNRDRIYDFYGKQADYFRVQPTTPSLLAEFPGLDGGEFGHWGNQNDTAWTDNRWNETQLGSVMCGVFRGNGATVPRGVCVRLGEDGEMSACFNPQTLTYDAAWTGGFVKFSSHRHGFLSGLELDGKPLPPPNGQRLAKTFKYRGYYRYKDRVLFSYRIDGTEMLDAPGVENGRFARVAAPADEHPLRHLLKDAPAQWPQEITTEIKVGDGKPYAVDTIGLPFDNPWNALLFCGGHAFLPDGSALVCTMQGDVWRVTGFEYPSRTATWRRFAAGLHEALGIVADKDGIFVLGRDQITRLHDLNGDGEADFYECFCNAYQTSPAGHDFICGLERDAQGNFYLASGNQGLIRVSPDGDKAEVIATGFRNPDGLGILPAGTLTVPCSEGDWTPASMICAVSSHGAAEGAGRAIPHFGYGGPQGERIPNLPLAYLPRGLDNSSGGQVYVSSDDWGPLSQQLLHFSFGMGSQFLVLRDEVEGQLQGAIVPLPGEFRSGAHRGRFNPADGQLYVTGMQGWVSFTPDDGCFQRVRYTGEAAQLPVGFHIHANGVMIEFSQPLDREVAQQATSHFAQCWNYRYGPAYGSAEFSARHDGMRGHDVLTIRSAHVLDGGRRLFLELPDLQPVNQLHLRVQSAAEEFHDLFVTVHRLGAPYTDFPDFRPLRKTIGPHPLLADLALATRSVPNPHRHKLDNARPITIATGTNLSFATRLVRVRAGEPIALTLANPDVVPHNWALIKPDAMQRVGELSDRSISDPEAVLRHYVPQTTDVLAYTNVAAPQENFTIYFHAPQQPGRYPYVCTFPGHWKVMNGVMIVEGAD